MILFLSVVIIWLYIIYSDIKQERNQYKNTLLMQQQERFKNDI